MDILNLCKLCIQNESKYVCPRCNIPYCSLSCYQSQAHSQCSESFYKECIVEQIKNDEPDSQSQKRMLEILQRVHQSDGGFEEDVADSDDESEGEELAARLAGVNLDDADAVWAQLSPDERQQFEQLVRSGDVSQVLPQWQPWWSYREDKILIEDLEGEPQQDESQLHSNCPILRSDIQPLSNLSKATPSSSVRWNVTNVVAAYAFTTRIYNGEHQSSAVEAASTLLALCDNLKTNQVYADPETAVAAVSLAATNSDGVAVGNDSQLTDDVHRLVQGPSESKQNLYVLAALSDIHALLTAARQKLKENSKSKVKGEFSKRFPDAPSQLSSGISVSECSKCNKKIDYYLSWTKAYF